MAGYELKQTILSIKDVSLKFGDQLILRDINTEVRDIVVPGRQQGQVITFAGPSGIGKTQLSLIIAGLRNPTTGTVLINDPPQIVKAGEVGYVTQDYRLIRRKRLRGNLEMAAENAGMSKSEVKEKVDYYINYFDLKGAETKFPAQLSGGQRQRVAIAQQLLCSSHFLIMDEPFSGLDPIMKEKVCELIINVSLMDELNTIIIISHDLRASLKVSDTVWLLGRDRDANGAVIPGARIKTAYDLMEMDLCWHPDIAQMPRFNEFVANVEQEFKTL